MAFVGTEIETDARRILNDTDAANERYVDADILAFIIEMIRLIWNKRGDSRYASTGAFLAYAEPATLAGTIIFDDTTHRWRSAILDGVLARCLEMEGKDTDDLNRAKHYAGQFTALTGIPLTVRGG